MEELVPIRTLSVAAHWAWGIIHGPKRIENRSWRTKHRGPLLIHANPSNYLAEEARRVMPDLPHEEDLVCGAAVGIVTLADCHPYLEAITLFPDDWDFMTGPWCWSLTEPSIIAPIPLLGKQRLFDALIPKSVLDRYIQS